MYKQSPKPHSLTQSRFISHSCHLLMQASQLQVGLLQEVTLPHPRKVCTIFKACLFVETWPSLFFSFKQSKAFSFRVHGFFYNAIPSKVRWLQTSLWSVAKFSIPLFFFAFSPPCLSLSSGGSQTMATAFREYLRGFASFH